MRPKTRHDSPASDKSWPGWLWLGGALTVLIIGVLAVYPAQPRTYREAIASALAHQDITYSTLVVNELRQPPAGDCFLHDCRESTALIIVNQEQPIYGRIVCQDGKADCLLTLPALGIYNEPIPDLAGMRRFPRTFDEGVIVVQAWIRAQIELLEHRLDMLSSRH